jgi:hypothetical protein
LKFHNHFARCSSCDVSYTKSNHRIKIATFWTLENGAI